MSFFSTIISIFQDSSGEDVDDAETTDDSVSLEKSKSGDLGLNSDQLALFRYMERTKTSLLITGSAGTGKTLLLKYFAHHTQKKVVLSSFTGIASSHINGQTLHSLFKIPINLGDL